MSLLFRLVQVGRILLQIFGRATSWLDMASKSNSTPVLVLSSLQIPRLFFLAFFTADVNGVRILDSSVLQQVGYANPASMSLQFTLSLTRSFLRSISVPSGISVVPGKTKDTGLLYCALSTPLVRTYPLVSSACDTSWSGAHSDAGSHLISLKPRVDKRKSRAGLA